MGCDIHAYVEYLDWTEQETGKEWWSCIVQGIGSRDYTMFGIMAGVRHAAVQLFEPKGFPEGEVSWPVHAAYYLQISDGDYAERDGCCSEEAARSWLENGYSTELMVGQLRYVSGPDWHSASWLTADELAQCLGQYLCVSTYGPYNIEWDVALAAMRTLEEAGKQTRLVFWFDN